LKESLRTIELNDELEAALRVTAEEFLDSRWSRQSPLEYFAIKENMPDDGRAENQFLQTLEKRIHSNLPSKILDVGSGDGRVAALAQKKGAELVLVEPVPSYAVQLKESYQRVYAEPFLNLGISERFDCIWFVRSFQVSAVLDGEFRLMDLIQKCLKISERWWIVTPVREYEKSSQRYKKPPSLSFLRVFEILGFTIERETVVLEEDNKYFGFEFIQVRTKAEKQ